MVDPLDLDVHIGAPPDVLVDQRPRSANVVAIEPTRYVSWPKSKLKDFMSKNPDLHSALKSTLAVDLTRWLEATWARGARQSATRIDHERLLHGSE